MKVSWLSVMRKKSSEIMWVDLSPTQHAAEEGSVCGCSSDCSYCCRVTPGCLDMEPIRSPNIHFYNVPVCHSVETKLHCPGFCPIWGNKVPFLSNMTKIIEIKIHFFCLIQEPFTPLWYLWYMISVIYMPSIQVHKILVNVHGVNFYILWIWYYRPRHSVKSQIVGSYCSSCHSVYVVRCKGT